MIYKSPTKCRIVVPRFLTLGEAWMTLFPIIRQLLEVFSKCTFLPSIKNPVLESLSYNLVAPIQARTSRIHLYLILKGNKTRTCKLVTLYFTGSKYNRMETYY